MSWTITPQTKVPVDPQYGSVSLLLHGNQNAGQFIDSSPTPKSITQVGNVAPGSPGGGTPIYPSSNSAFGSAIAFDGTGDYLSATANSAFAFETGNFTLEGWFYFVNGAENAIRIMYANYTSFALVNTPLFFGKHVSNSGRISVYLYLAAGTVANFSEPNTPPSNQWLHYTLVKAGSSFTIYRDGIATATATYAGQSFTSTQCNVGGSAENASYCHNGYIDDFRITKGVARYTANFTPPAAPFPDI